MLAIWNDHTYSEFVLHSVNDTMETVGPNPVIYAVS